MPDTGLCIDCHMTTAPNKSVAWAMKNRHTYERNMSIFRRVRDGVKPSFLAKEYGISRARIAQIVIKVQKRVDEGVWPI